MQKPVRGDLLQNISERVQFSEKRKDQHDRTLPSKQQKLLLYHINTLHLTRPKVTQMSNKGCILFESSRKEVEPRLREDCSRAP